MESLRDQAEIARSRIEASKTRLAAAQVARYLDPPADTIFPLEYAFHLLGDIHGKHVLDLGCGTGENIPALVRRGADVTGIDISPDLIALARQRMHAQNIVVDLNVGSAYRVELPSHSVDVIFSMSLIHHLDVPLALTEMRRILKPDGFIVMKEPISFSPVYSKMRKVFSARDDVSEYEHPLTIAEFEEIEARFHVSDLRFFRLPFAGLSRRLEVNPVPLLRASDFILRHWPSLERFATVVVMKLQIETDEEWYGKMIA